MLWPPTPAPLQSMLTSASIQFSRLGTLHSQVIHFLILTPHPCTVISWVTCILSRHINRMTGHHRLQEQLTPPRKHLFVWTSHSVHTPSTESFILARSVPLKMLHHITLMVNQIIYQTSQILRGKVSILSGRLCIFYFSGRCPSYSFPYCSLCWYSFHSLEICGRLGWDVYFGEEEEEGKLCIYSAEHWDPIWSNMRTHRMSSSIHQTT